MNPDQEKIKLLFQSTPFFIGRIAGIELQVAYHLKYGILTRQHIDELENNAGIHVTSNESLKKYTEMLLNSYQSCTYIAEWDRSGKVYEITGHGQELIAKQTPHIPKIDALALEPYYFDNSWMEQMSGKRVLIVHPFVESCKKQIPHFTTIFPRPWFTNCTFEFVKPPVTLAGNHENKDWYEHYTICINEIKKADFDIALVAAGGYGMLLSDSIFTMGKSVMYVGGALQIFFGIIGKRWFDNKEIMKWVNDDWVRPSAKEKPANATKVEKGCYW
jgi:hypothetical protein